MRRLGFVVALLSTAAITLTSSTTAVAAEHAEVRAAYVKVALIHEGKTYAHPGFRVEKNEEGLFVIECEGKNHEVAIVLREGNDEQLRITVEYSVDGRSLLAQELQVEPGKDAQLSKGKTKLAINVDPHGKKDTSRKDDDKIEGPGGDNPLD